MREAREEAIPREGEAKTGPPPKSDNTLANGSERRSQAIPADGLDPEAGAPSERRDSDHQPLGVRPAHAEEGLSHHGDPDAEEEVIVLESPESRDTEPQNPKTPCNESGNYK